VIEAQQNEKLNLNGQRQALVMFDTHVTSLLFHGALGRQPRKNMCSHRPPKVVKRYPTHERRDLAAVGKTKRRALLTRRDIPWATFMVPHINK